MVFCSKDNSDIPVSFVAVTSFESLALFEFSFEESREVPHFKVYKLTRGFQRIRS